MVAIVAGKGLGLFNTSLNTVGALGVLGQSTLGQGSYRAILNVVNGNLILQTQDAQLAGRGMDLFALHTYNSLGAPTDGDEDGWRWGYEQTVRFEGPGTPLQPASGARVIRTDGDGHETPYTWNPARAAFVSTEGRGAHDELRYEGGATEWVWVDGSTRVTERYSNSTTSTVAGRLIQRTDTSNNSITLTYDAGRLTGIRDTVNGQELQLEYEQFDGLTRLQRLKARLLTDDANGHATATLGDPLLLAEYDYDSQGRLKSATRYLSPADSNAPAGASFITTIGYDDSSLRIALRTWGPAMKWGARASWVGSAIVAPITIRDAIDNFEKGDAGNVAVGVGKIGGIVFPPVGVMAVSVEVAAEEATPVFSGAINQIYGIWGMPR